MVGKEKIVSGRKSGGNQEKIFLIERIEIVIGLSSFLKITGRWEVGSSRD